MENPDPVILILIGGLISLVSTLAGITLQHWFDLLKQEHETRRYPAEILFNKQTEFYDKVIHILPGINEYITAINVWLGETSPDAKQTVKKLSGKTKPIWEFHELSETYSMYLPEKILKAGNQLLQECFDLSNSQTMEKTDVCINLLFSFQNIIRECVGTDRISADLLKSFEIRKRERTNE